MRKLPVPRHALAALAAILAAAALGAALPAFADHMTRSGTQNEFQIGGSSR